MFWTEALNECQEALRINPRTNSATIYYSCIGKASMVRGEEKKSVDAYVKSVETARIFPDPIRRNRISEESLNQLRLSMYRYYGSAAEIEFFSKYGPKITDPLHSFEICIRQRSKGNSLTQKVLNSCANLLKRKNSRKGGLTSQEIMAVIRFNLLGIRNCYESVLKVAPDLQGKMSVRFIVGTNGKIKSVTTTSVSSDLKNTSLTGCIEKKISDWIFPRPRGKQDVTVNYPFVFNPL